MVLLTGQKNINVRSLEGDLKVFILQSADTFNKSSTVEGQNIMDLMQNCICDKHNLNDDNFNLVLGSYLTYMYKKADSKSLLGFSYR